MVVFIPGWLIALLTFPGVILHEYAHKKAVEASGLTVYHVVYFRLGNPAGYVIHEPPYTFRQALAITMAPLLINTLAEVLTLLLLVFIPSTSLLGFVVWWLAISFGMHAIPSTEDAKVLWDYSRSNWRYEKKALLGFPIAGIVYLLSLAKVVWADLFYAIGVMFALNSVIKIF